jgi:hypothetical protein
MLRRVAGVARRVRAVPRATLKVASVRANTTIQKRNISAFDRTHHVILNFSAQA